MRLLQALDRFFLFLIFLFCGPSHAYADNIITESATMFGSVTSFKADGIQFQNACQGPIVNVPWTEVLILHFDKRCTPGETNPPTAPLQVCKEALVHVFKARVKGQIVFLTRISMLPGQDIRGLPYRKSGSITMRRSDTEYIQPTDACPSSISILELPSAVCVEPEQFAVNWSTDPLFNNQIFTKGFSIYIHSEPPLSDELRRDIDLSFGTALTSWSSLLEEHVSELDPELKSYVITSTSRSAQFTLYSPPQVVEVHCEPNALLIVDWVTESNSVFPKNEGYVARAQLQGRTILLNARENNFGYRADFMHPLAPGIISLISVFIHELGHCLGLPDDIADPTSVMNPHYVASIINQTVSPSSADFRRFSDSLRASIRGTAPGFFDVKDCAGLKRE